MGMFEDLHQEWVTGSGPKREPLMSLRTVGEARSPAAPPVYHQCTARRPE
jgi:hypothetical protein